MCHFYLRNKCMRTLWKLIFLFFTVLSYWINIIQIEFYLKSVFWKHFLRQLAFLKMFFNCFFFKLKSSDWTSDSYTDFWMKQGFCVYEGPCPCIYVNQIKFFTHLNFHYFFFYMSTSEKDSVIYARFAS